MPSRTWRWTSAVISMMCQSWLVRRAQNTVGKFVRRHRSGVATAGTLMALLVVFAGVMAVQATRIARARDRANQEAATAKQVSDFLVGLFQVSDRSEARGNSLTARELLDKGANDIAKDLRTQPDVRLDCRPQSVLFIRISAPILPLNSH